MIWVNLTGNTSVLYILFIILKIRSDLYFGYRWCHTTDYYFNSYCFDCRRSISGASHCSNPGSILLNLWYIAHLESTEAWEEVIDRAWTPSHQSHTFHGGWCNHHSKSSGYSTFESYNDVGVKTSAINLACITYYIYAYHDFWKKLRCS